MPSAESSVNIEEAESLLGYLRERRFIDRNENPRFQILRGSVSNRTVLIRRESGEDWVLKQALRLLRHRGDFLDMARAYWRRYSGALPAITSKSAQSPSPNDWRNTIDC